MTADTTNRFARSAAATAILTLAQASTSALAEIMDITWDASGRYERSISIAPGRFAEVCGKLPTGLNIGWNFEASAPLDFNVHYHVGKQLVFPSKLVAVAAAQDTLATKIDQDYCWMWSNKSKVHTTLLVKLQR
jgi:hypothetical protein